MIGRRRQPEVTVSAAPETAESSSVPQCMPGLAVVDQIIAPSTTGVQPAAHCRPPALDQTSHTGSMAAADWMTSPVALSSRTLRRSIVSTASWTQPTDVAVATTRPSLQPVTLTKLLRQVRTQRSRSRPRLGPSRPRPQKFVIAVKARRQELHFCEHSSVNLQFFTASFTDVRRIPIFVTLFFFIKLYIFVWQQSSAARVDSKRI